LFLFVGTTVMPQISAVMHDERIFENPKTFDPERFIRNPSLADKVVPFGLGKRQCMGESLARLELFMIFVTLFQHFSFELKDPNAKDYTKIRAVFTNHPQVYECIITNL
jgi:cytochrome P450